MISTFLGIPYRIILLSSHNINSHNNDQQSRSRVIIHAHLVSYGILLILMFLLTWSGARAGFIAYDSGLPLREFKGHQGSMCLPVNQYRSHSPHHRLALPPLRPGNWFRWTHLVLLTGTLIVPRTHWEEILKPFPPHPKRKRSGWCLSNQRKWCVSFIFVLGLVGLCHCGRSVRQTSIWQLNSEGFSSANGLVLSWLSLTQMNSTEN